MAEPLTKREQEILVCLAEGLSNQEIANQLYLAEKTVRWYNSQIYNKLSVSSRAEAVEQARALGLLAAPIPEGKHNLPAQATPFVGREHELDELDELLNDANTRLITILAPGGMGKTRLALEAARIQMGRYTDGVYFVPLAPLSAASDIITTIAEIIGFSFFGKATPTQQLIGFLSERSTLLMLDNFEHLLEGASLVADIIRDAPRVRILVTSRERLNLHGETVYTLRGLDFPAWETSEAALAYDAVKLFMQSARRIRPDFTLQSDSLNYLARICRLTAGMPLGIELAAGWVDVLSLEQIAAEIQRGIDILETEMRDVPERQRSIRATFDYTWRRLTKAEQQMFMRLSLFRGGFSVEAAQAITDADLPSLRKLANKALIQVSSDGHRYDIHELLRQYTEEQLSASGETAAAREAHSAYYASFLHEKWGTLRTAQQVRTLDEIEIEFENIRAAWKTMAENGKAAHLSLAVYPIWYYSDLRGRYHETLALFKQAEDLLRPTSSNDVVARALGQVLARQGYLFASSGKPPEGQVLAAESLTILKQVGTHEDLVLALDSLCLVSQMLSEMPAWKQSSEQAAQIVQRSDDRWLLARTRYWQASVAARECRLAASAVRSDDLEAAKRLGREAVKLAEACGDLWLIAQSGEVAAQVARLSGDYAEALRWHERVLKLLEELGQAVTLAMAHWGLANSLLGMNDSVGAVFQYQKSLKILAAHGGYTAHQIEALRLIARVWSAQGNLAGAVELLTLVLHHPESFPQGRAWAGETLRQLQAELPPIIFATAEQRGQQWELNALVAEILADAGGV